MKDHSRSLAAVFAGGGAAWLGGIKWCCVLPAVLSGMGLASTSWAMVAVRWLSPFLALLSLALLARSFHHLYVRKRGSRLGKAATWTAAGTVAAFWALRLAGILPA